MPQKNFKNWLDKRLDRADKEKVLLLVDLDKLSKKSLEKVEKSYNIKKFDSGFIEFERK